MVMMVTICRHFVTAGTIISIIVVVVAVIVEIEVAIKRIHTCRRRYFVGGTHHKVLLRLSCIGYW